MKMVSKTLRLTSREGFGARVPPSQFGQVLELIAPSVRQAVRMAFQGRSVGPGRRPDWLQAAADVRFVGLSGNRDTILNFEAPTLGDAAPQVYEQQEFDFADSRPAPDLTAFDVFGKVLDDIVHDNKDSDRFDRRLLHQVTRYGRAFGNAFDSLLLNAEKKSGQIVLNRETIKQAQLLRIEIPKPRRVRVVGRLDMIRVSTSAFELKLDDGTEIRGVYLGGTGDTLASLLNTRVVVDGRAVYRPSGRILRIDAEQIIASQNEPGIWSRVPPPLNRTLRLKELRKTQSPTTGLGAIVGKWPGSESDAEIEKALQELG